MRSLLYRFCAVGQGSASFQPHHNTFHDACLLVVQPRDESGKIIIRAESAGLLPAIAELEAASAVLINSQILLTAQCAGEGGNSLGFDMAPETSQHVVEDAVKQIPTTIAPGPVKPTWVSLEENKAPSWFQGLPGRYYPARTEPCLGLW